MKFQKFARASLATLALVSTALPAFAESVVVVQLWEKSGEVADGMGMGMHGDMATATMGMDINKASVPAGKVAFRVTNNAKETYHQLLVAPITGSDVTLPYVADESRVDEAAMGVLGEGVTLAGHGSGSFTLDLEPGLYALICNVTGHYMTGMWTTLEVTP